ncbi:ATPase [Thermoplasma sp. Kam2015]|uniref:PINc/VapC family ATPase n=1 Tax=Thermoplasma sp. Kam2015 TaxID=2094122 RepID=UPI000D8D5328|nr:ATPase, T2SS/T4P/T4SS family [Thermoplasma sp. Kam2015]PYB68877.1 ATPase [Thermoplasma sp. Kam2015]
MNYVPDTSVIVDGRFTQYIQGKEDANVLLPEAMLSEVEHQANEGRSIGFAALEELKKLRSLEREGKISIEIVGERPREWQIKRAKSGEIDEMIRSVALQYDAILVTGDNIQRDVAIIKGINVEYLQPPEKIVKNIEEFFEDTTMSVHLKAGTNPVLKDGKPGSIKYRRLDYILNRSDLENIASNIVKRGKLEADSFIEMDAQGATVVQLKNIRIVITRPPFSDDLEITAVRPVVKLGIDYYELDDKIKERLESSASGILVAGSPGAGKSTFVQALAEFFNARGKIVKTMERPRDLDVSKEITQYTELEGSMEMTGDILLLVRPDYTIFDEMRVTNDFKVYADLRLAGVGMVGVVHATRAIDALQRFIGRIELGLIPQIIDTIIYINNGQVAQVLSTQYTVKIPYGMTQEDLARPVIVVSDLITGKDLYEIYSFGEQIVVVPIKERKESSMSKLAVDRIEDYIKHVIRSDDVEVKMVGDSRAIVRVDPKFIPKLIGRSGKNITEIEKKLGIKIDVEESGSSSERQKAGVEIKNKIIYIDVGHPNKHVRIYLGEVPILQALSSSKGIVRIKLSTEIGNAIYNHIKNGGDIFYSID